MFGLKGFSPCLSHQALLGISKFILYSKLWILYSFCLGNVFWGSW